MSLYNVQYNLFKTKFEQNKNNLYKVNILSTVLMYTTPLQNLRSHAVREVNKRPCEIDKRSTQKHPHPLPVGRRNQRRGHRPTQNPRNRSNRVANGERRACMVRRHVHVIRQMSSRVTSRKPHRYRYENKRKREIIDDAEDRKEQSGAD